MHIEQRQWTKEGGWKTITDEPWKEVADWVFVFGGRAKLEDAATFPEIKKMYPQARILLCSTAGEILGSSVRDGSLSLTAMRWEKTTIRTAVVTVKSAEESYEAGKTLAQGIPHEGLVHAMVFSDGQRVNGTPLVKGLTETLPEGVAVTGGLVGDGVDFKKTLIGIDAPAEEGKIVLLGFYGQDLRVGYGSLGGWDPFGPERLITRSEGNVLYELDGQPALALYKKYLSDRAKDLPASGLLFPLQLRLKKTGQMEQLVTRTVLNIDEKAQSLTFAGDMPEGIHAQLMKANLDRLIDGAVGAGTMSVERPGNKLVPQLAVLISCVGRKLVLKDRVEDEIEAVRDTIGQNAAVCGFYSYGEISPTAPTEKQCELHNQTMTITTFQEV